MVKRAPLDVKKKTITCFNKRMLAFLTIARVLKGRQTIRQDFSIKFKYVAEVHLQPLKYVHFTIYCLLRVFPKRY